MKNLVKSIVLVIVGLLIFNCGNNSITGSDDDGQPIDTTSIASDSIIFNRLVDSVYFYKTSGIEDLIDTSVVYCVFVGLNNPDKKEFFIDSIIVVPNNPESPDVNNWQIKYFAYYDNINYIQYLNTVFNPIRLKRIVYVK